MTLFRRLGNWLSRYRAEACGRCGRRVEVIWSANDELWKDAGGGAYGILCIGCFDLLAAPRLLRWVPFVIRDLENGQWVETEPMVNPGTFYPMRGVDAGAAKGGSSVSEMRVYGDSGGA